MFATKFRRRATLPVNRLGASSACFGRACRLLILCSTLVIVQGGGHHLNSQHQSLYSLTSSFGESDSDTWIFPNASYSDLRNASLLADFLSSKLSSGPTRYLDETRDASQVLFRNPPSQDPFLDSYLMSEPSAVFSSSDGSIFELFYDQVSANVEHSENGSIVDVEFGPGKFLGLSATLSDSTIYASGELEYESTVREVAQSLGIPATNMTSVTTASHEDRIKVVLSSLLLGYAVAGCNIVSAEFRIPDGRLVQFQSRPHLALPDSFATSEAEAFEISRAIVPAFYKDDEIAHIASDEILGVRAQPFYDQRTPGPESNLSLPGGTVLGFRLGYEYLANMSSNIFSTNYPVLVVVDVDSGLILLSEREPTPTPSGYAFLKFLYEWHLALASSLVILCVFTAILLGPPDLAIVLFGFLVPVRLRLSRGIDVLDNFNRGRIFEHVMHHPGCSFSELKARLHLHNGNLAYHLAVLERLGFIRSVKDGWARRYTVQGAKDDVPLCRLLGSTECRVLRVLVSKGPLAGIGIARELNISRQRAHYNLKRLLRRGLVERSGSGWAVTSSITPDAVSTNESSRVK